MAKRTMPVHRQRRPNEGYVMMPVAVARELFEATIDMLATTDCGVTGHLGAVAQFTGCRDRLREAVGSLEAVLTRHARRAS